MQGNTQVLAELSTLLTGELSAADQYFVHSRMYQNWGYHRLYERLEHERVEELTHADRIIRRILFLGGIPNVSAREALRIGGTVPEMLKNDLVYELEVVERLRKAIAVCEQQKDFETRRILIELLRDTEEDHTHWLEIQLGLVQQLGLPNYLQSAAGDIKAGEGAK